MIWLRLAAAAAVAGCSQASTRSPESTAPSPNVEKPVAIIHDYRSGLPGVHVANPEVKLRVDRDTTLGGASVLLVDYPPPIDNLASRDVRLDAGTRNWTAGKAISFRVKPAHEMRISVSFLDRNHVAYTAWRDLREGVWQPIRISFAEIRPNPYFQPPGARSGAPIDVSEVNGLAFAPQDKTAGRLAISRFVVIE
jgi:hypothetical protein